MRLAGTLESFMRNLGRGAKGTVIVSGTINVRDVVPRLIFLTTAVYRVGCGILSSLGPVYTSMLSY